MRLLTENGLCPVGSFVFRGLIAQKHICIYTDVCLDYVRVILLSDVSLRFLNSFSQQPDYVLLLSKLDDLNLLIISDSTFFRTVLTSEVIFGKFFRINI